MTTNDLFNVTIWSGPIEDVIEHDGPNPDCPCKPVLRRGALEHNKMEGRLMRNTLLELGALAKELRALLREQKA